MIRIDGAQGEGGDQILRSSLSLALLTGQPFELVNVRAGRARPGLLRQHLTAVEAAAAIGRAEVTGAQLGSRALTFAPHGVAPGEYRFAVGTAGEGSFTTLPLTRHATTNLEVLGRFVDLAAWVEPGDAGGSVVSLRAR